MKLCMLHFLKFCILSSKPSKVPNMFLFHYVLLLFFFCVLPGFLAYVAGFRHLACENFPPLFLHYGVREEYSRCSAFGGTRGGPVVWCSPEEEKRTGGVVLSRRRGEDCWSSLFEKARGLAVLLCPGHQQSIPKSYHSTPHTFSSGCGFGQDPGCNI